MFSAKARVQGLIQLLTKSGVSHFEFSFPLCKMETINCCALSQGFYKPQLGYCR